MVKKAIKRKIAQQTAKVAEKKGFKFHWSYSIAVFVNGKLGQARSADDFRDATLNG